MSRKSIGADLSFSKVFAIFVQMLFLPKILFTGSLFQANVFILFFGFGVSSWGNLISGAGGGSRGPPGGGGGGAPPMGGGGGAGPVLGAGGGGGGAGAGAGVGAAAGVPAAGVLGLEAVLSVLRPQPAVHALQPVEGLVLT